MKRKRALTIGIFALFLITACVTVNIYFPAAEVQEAADKIVGDVRGQGTDEAPKEQVPSESGEKESWLRFLPSLGLSPGYAFAAVDINITTPAIRALQESLKKRFPDLKPFYDEGRIGETNNGFVEKKDLDGLGLKEKSKLLKLIDEENKDRTNLYEEILKANKLGPENLEEVKKIFANSWRDKSSKGWWIQKDDGNWIKKE